MKAPSKIDRLLERVREALDTGGFLDTIHIMQRQTERQITRPEMLYVLRHGWHEKRKDVFDTRYQAWNYAIRGKTIDERPLRVVVSFEKETRFLIITAIALGE
jgi:phage terminase large subunit-like protein